MAIGLIARTVCGLIEPSVRAVAERLFILTGGRAGSQVHKPTIATFYETGLVTSLYEFLLMSPHIAHLEVRHEMTYPAATRPKQVDLWIRPIKGGYAHLFECGDFTPRKVKDDASKMRNLNPNGTNWFLAFFRDENAEQPWRKLKECRGRRGSLKGTHIELVEELTKSFVISLPSGSHHFGYSLIRIKS